MAKTSASKPRSYDGDYMDVGKLAEDVMMSFIESTDDIVEFEDLREIKAMQIADADFLLRMRTGHVVLAEVKGDELIDKYGNVVFELLRINFGSSPTDAVSLGWSARSGARWLFYLDITKGKLHHCEFVNLRRVFQSHAKASRMSLLKNIRVVQTDKGKITVTYLLPLDELREHLTTYDVSSLVEAVQKSATKKAA